MNAAMHLPVPPPPLAPTLSDLLHGDGGNLGGGLRRTLDRLRGLGFRHLQINAAQPGFRPRELDRSARRDLLALLRRREMQPAGVDLWIPQEHFRDPSHIDRATSATFAAIEMAADLGHVPISLALPPPDVGGQADEALDALFAAAEHYGVPIADHAVFDDSKLPRPTSEFSGLGIDPAAWLSAGRNPVDVVTANASSTVSARLCDISTAGMRSPIGEPGGRLDVRGYLVALSVARYQRPVVLDARQWSNAWSGIEQSLNLWR